MQFSVFSRSATAMRLLLYNKVSDREPAEIIEFDRDTDRWGDVWSLNVPGSTHGQLYHLQASGPWDPDHGHRFDSSARLIDPYAQALAGEFQKSDDGVIRPPKCVVVDDTLIGKVIAISAATSASRSSTKCTFADSPRVELRRSKRRAPTWA